MRSNLSVVVYTQDPELVPTLQGLLGTQGNVIQADDADPDITLRQLVCIDNSYPHRQLILDILRDFERSFVLCLISANPFAAKVFAEYDIDAFLAKPLSAESIQALIVGTKARIPLYGLGYGIAAAGLA
jgi:hypothetical protein